jgi:serine/threonine protein kinase
MWPNRRGELNECKPAQWKAQKGDGWLTAPVKMICWQVLSRLSFLHSRQIAHRDIRPTNVFTALQYDLSSFHENEIQKSVWPTDDVQNEEEDDESNDEDDDDGEDDDDNDDGDEDDDDDGGDDDESTISDPQERLRREQEEEKDRKWLEDFDRRRQKYAEFEAIVDSKWETFGRGDPLAVPHSEEWNTANLMGTRNDIEMLIRVDGKDPEPDELQYTVRRTALQSQLDLSKPFRVILGDLGCALPFSKCAKYTIGTEHVYRPPEDLLDLKLTYKADIFSAGFFCWKVAMLDELVERCQVQPISPAP